MNFSKNLTEKLEIRKQNNALRELSVANNLIDFMSNDYIGFSRNKAIFEKTQQYLIDHKIIQNGATASQLISENHSLYETTESFIAYFHQAESALIFNSAYNVNVGFFSSVPQKGDLIMYDELCHASIQDGIQLSNAKAYEFQHNDFEDLEKQIVNFNSSNIEKNTSIYMVTESVFSMDGDCPNLEELVLLADKYACKLVVDETHSLGVFGEKGEGLVQMMGLQNHIFARILTFEKGLGCHGAAIVGSAQLKEYLVNFAGNFIYSKGLSFPMVATILMAYQQLELEKETIENLRQNIVWFNQQKKLTGLQPLFIRSKSAIQCAIIQGNEKVKLIANQIQEKGFDVKAILSPTVPEGQERLRFCIHSYNTKEEIEEVVLLLSAFVFSQ